MKSSFILHLDSLDILNEMSLEQKGILFDAIYNYHKGVDVDLDFAMKMAFAPFKNQFIRDNQKYSDFVDKQASNGSKGGRPRKEINPKNPSLLKEPKKAYSDSVNDSDSDSFKKNERPIHEFPTPTIYENIETWHRNYKTDRINLERVAMQNNIDIDPLLKLENDFYLDCKSLKKFHKDEFDYRMHFKNWMNKQPKPKSKNKYDDVNAIIT